MNRIVITKIEYNKKNFISCIEINDDRKFEKLQLYSTETISLVGNIYCARVEKIVKGINAAFVKISKETNCYLSLNEAKNPIYTNKRSKKSELCEGDEILVQITKDAIKTKDPVVSANISISSKFCVTTINNKLKAVSKKINSERSLEIKHILDECLLNVNHTDCYGIVIRTSAKNAGTDELKKDILENINQMNKIIQGSQFYGLYSKIYETEAPYISKLKGVDFDEIEMILTDDDEIFGELKTYFNNLSENKIVKYEDDYSLNHLYQINSNIDKLVSKQVWLKSGGNILIEQLETLTFIDVNSAKGSYAKENVVLKINLEAAGEIARQLKLRNISGMIIVDFINMESEEMQTELINYLKKLLKNDEVSCSYIDITKLGLVEITRKKVYKSLKEIL